MTRARAASYAVFAAVSAALLVLPALRAGWRVREENAIVRGARLSARLGCTACHLGRAIPNPGSREGAVPLFGSGALGRYAKTREEAERIVREGSPAKESGLTPVVFMPAYGKALGKREVADLVSYVRAMDGEDVPAPVRPGWEVARRHGCLSCHGAGGAGGVPNPGSLTGEIPGFLGAAYADLVASPEEFHDWVRTGAVSRVVNRPLALRFLEAQRTSMPAFPKEVLSDEELAAIQRWIAAARAAGPR